MKASLHEALVAFQRFRRAQPAGRSLEIRLLDGAAHTTGWEVGPSWNHFPGKIGGGVYSGLNLDGEDRWRGLRIVTSEVYVVYGDGSGYSVFIKEGVTSIGKGAFYGCTELNSVTFPEGLTDIGMWAFQYCTGLTSVTFPEGLTSIGYRAFEDCTGLTSVTFPEGLTSIGGSAFNKCSGLTSVTFPDGLTSIGDDAFDLCPGLDLVTVPDSVQLGSRAFSGYTRVKKSVNPCVKRYWYNLYRWLTDTNRISHTSKK